MISYKTVRPSKKTRRNKQSGKSSSIKKEGGNKNIKKIISYTPHELDYDAEHYAFRSVN